MLCCCILPGNRSSWKQARIILLGSKYLCGLTHDSKLCILLGLKYLFAVQARAIPGPRIYLAAAYWSLTTVSTIGFGDVTPITDAERAVLLLLELTGVLFFGILLSSITSLLQVRTSPVAQVILCLSFTQQHIVCVVYKLLSV